MEIEIIGLIIFIISILVMLGCGKSRKDAPLTGMATILVIVTGWSLVTGYPLVYGTNSIFTIFVAVLGFFGLVKVINALL